MKAVMYDAKGKKKADVVLPEVFSTIIREDIIHKVFRTMLVRQPSAPMELAGRKNSASGTISHKRHDWKGHYGRGISRIPRKTMWRRGTQFYWIGAGIPGTRGGPKAHPPKGIGKEKKMNAKEFTLAMQGAIAATAQKDFVLSRYASLEKVGVPVVLESIPEKAKDFVSVLGQVFAGAEGVVLRKRAVRAGKGTRRGRKHKMNAGVLVLTGSDEQVKTKVVESKSIGEVELTDLVPLGRLTVFTKVALDELGGEKK